MDETLKAAIHPSEEALKAVEKYIKITKPRFDSICVELCGYSIWRGYQSKANEQEAHNIQLFARMGLAIALDDHVAKLKASDFANEVETVEARMEEQRKRLTRFQK